ncbi:MAG: cytochrome ubiquinol oxidase subunit I [Proteobacteria bacterium]|nr:cytochrome ubiquinol oxidase subunit I [Pseudomonadota bacterium]
MDTFDPLILARIQFGFTVSFHIIFPAFTIGLASFLTVLEAMWLKTDKPVYKRLYKFWVKVFAVAFGLGVVSGVVMSYQFGTNWSVFSTHTGNILGPLLGYEVLTAFFLEASFLGIMLFGWGRVSPKMHFASTAIVAFGTLISAFWILSANSWMQTPQGFSQDAAGIFHPEDWWAIIFNPSFPYRLVHMVTAAFLTTAFVVGAVGAWHILKQRYLAEAKVMFGMAMLMALLVAPAQLVIGDMHGLNTLEHQPIKVAAMEGIWETEQGAGFRVLAWPNQDEARNDFELTVPYASSLILTHSLDGEVKGLNHWPAEEHPPVMAVFWSFRIMLAIGFAMIFTGLVAAWRYWRGTLYRNNWFMKWCILMGPTGFIALLAGWFVTEIGRQPYTVYGILRTSDSLSPVIGEQVALSLGIFIVVYTALFGAGTYYIFKIFKKGPGDQSDPDYYQHSRQVAGKALNSEGDQQ